MNTEIAKAYGIMLHPVAGHTQGNLTFTGKIQRNQFNKKIFYEINCACGNTLWMHRNIFIDGAQYCKKCSNITHGEHETRLYRIWAGMRSRCNNPTDVNYFRYGAKGIKIAACWDSYVEFAEWSKANGYADTLTIDRINPDGGYAPDNCQWITMRENVLRARKTTKAIRCLETGEIFAQASILAKQLGCCRRTVCRFILEQRPWGGKTYGYK